MARKTQIEIREADLGPVIARADHVDGAIEVNSEIFYKLPPMVQEFVLCHEVCHLRYEEWDEARTNRLASDLFISRASGDDDRKVREKFVGYMDGRDYSNFAWETLIAGVVNAGFTAYGIIAQRNGGWYKLDDSTKRSMAQALVEESFEQSRRSGSKSAADFFWSAMRNYTAKDDSLEQFLGRSDNSFVQQYITAAEKRYGFGFSEVTPIDLTAFPVVMVAIGIAIGYIVFRIIKKYRK